MAVASSICPSASAIRMVLEETGRSAMSTWAWTSTSIPSRGASLTRDLVSRRGPCRNGNRSRPRCADAEPPDQVVVNEILRCGAGAALVEGHHHGARKSGAGQQTQLVGLVGETELGLFGLKKLRGCGSKVTAKAGLPWARPCSGRRQ